MVQALWSAGALGAVVALVVLGMLYERHRRPSTTLLDVTVRLKASERTLQSLESDANGSGAVVTPEGDQGKHSGP